MGGSFMPSILGIAELDGAGDDELRTFKNSETHGKILVMRERPAFLKPLPSVIPIPILQSPQINVRYVDKDSQFKGYQVKNAPRYSDRSTYKWGLL